MIKSTLTLAAMLLLLTACANHAEKKYEWGSYEQSLYSYYKNPANPDELILSLQTTIKTAEATNKKVPPGLYAELGYLLMVQGKQQEAIANFENEKRRWPESTNLMDRMTKLAQSQPSKLTEVKQ